MVETPSRAGGWLLREPSPDSDCRLFCFPYSGVGASMFSRWPERIGEIETCLVQPPGRENRFREPHFGTYDALVDELAPLLAPYLDRPYGFFGHCAAALSAFETARRLEALGVRPPRVLVASAQVAPIDCPHDRFLYLGRDELLDELVALTRRRGAEPRAAMLDLALEVLERDVEANRRYEADAVTPVGFPIRVLHWNRDEEVTWEELATWAEYSPDVRRTLLDGGHYDFLDAPEELLGVLSDAFRTA